MYSFFKNRGVIMKQGIAFAGNLICDTVMTIKEYPQKGRISQIYKTEKSVGGLVPNTAINFKKMNIDIPTYTYGRIGEDENGKFLLDQLKKYGINCDNIGSHNSKRRYRKFYSSHLPNTYNFGS